MKLTVTGIMSDGSIAPNAKLKNLRWIIQDTSIAKIEGNRIIPVSKGSTKAMANVNGIIAFVDINVV